MILMIKMRTYKIFIVFLVGLMYQKLIGQLKVWTLEECIELAIEKNISIKQGQLNYEDALIDKNDAKANFLPTINLNACLLYTSPSPRDRTRSRMPSSA